MSLATEAMPETRLHFYHFPAVNVGLYVCGAIHNYIYTSMDVYLFMT